MAMDFRRNYSPKAYDIGRKALYAIKQTVNTKHMTIADNRNGICVHFSNLIDKTSGGEEAYSLMKRLIREWPEKHLSHNFPVGGIDEYYELSGSNLYDPNNEWGAKRLRLLDWLINEFEKGPNSEVAEDAQSGTTQGTTGSIT